jgi:hypothetical protein
MPVRLLAARRSSARTVEPIVGMVIEQCKLRGWSDSTYTARRNHLAVSGPAREWVMALHVDDEDGPAIHSMATGTIRFTRVDLRHINQLLRNSSKAQTLVG